MLQGVLDHAQYYSELGLAVLPLHFPVHGRDGSVCSCGGSNCPSPAKHPVGHLAPNGTKNATLEPPVIEGWFKEAPWNIGIVTGTKSGIIVADVDPRHGGDESIARLEQENGPLPTTWQFLTGSGGQHLLFRHPGGMVPNSAGKLGSGLDIRGDGGYIVAPPSQHMSGRPYAFSVDHHPDDTPLAAPPGWLQESLKVDVRTALSPEEWRKRIGSSIPEGRRNDSLTSITGHLLAHGIDPHVCLDIILSLNVTHCAEPLPEDEILKLVAGITRREKTRRPARRNGGARG